MGLVAAAILVTGRGVESPSRGTADYLPKSVGETHKQSLGHICNREGVQDSTIDPTKNSDQNEDDTRKKLIKSALENLKWWRENLVIWKSRSFLPEVPEAEVFTDASDSGWGLRAVLGPTSELFDCPTDELSTFCTQFIRRFFKDGYTDGMVNTRKDIQQDRYEVQTARCGYVRSPGEPQTVDIFQLETITRSSNNGSFQSPVEFFEESILPPTLESHHEDNPEGQPREINLDTNNS
ncbi:hypothetical protein AYI70_g3818 [Smittium culicis]|uniref:Uncharacterized protein n=1 Tax=Smittium culicis TaxID=133412 RepID=A0A1R1Y1V5_9FUNG|nr:hypothetical protein AYI70_g3818 [Smittium culicis]